MIISRNFAAAGVLLGFFVTDTLGARRNAELAAQTHLRRGLRRHRTPKSQAQEDKKKSTKSTKSTKKSSKGEDGTLFANFDYCTDSSGIDGFATARFQKYDDNMWLQLHGFDVSDSGTVYIDESTECICNATSPDYLYDPDATSNPWPERYIVDPGDATSSFFYLSSGYGFRDNEGHAVYLKDSSNTTVACGILEPTTWALKAYIETIPSYSGDLDPYGYIHVDFNAADEFRVEYDLYGVEEECSNCTIVIYDEFSCDDVVVGASDPDENSLPFYDTLSNPWTVEYGAVYLSDYKGRADGSFFLFNTLEYDQHVGLTAVVHDSANNPIGCGLLEVK